MIRILVAVLALLAIHTRTYAQDRFCFHMQAVKRNIKVQMSLDEKWDRGYVRYQGQKDSILIKYKRATTLENNRGIGRPDEVQYDFEEIVGGKATGLYSLIVQGIPQGASYLRYRDKKGFAMEFDAADEDCLEHH